MRRFLLRANKTLTLGWAASLLAGSYLLSALLGLLRERLLLANFGIGPTLDAYYIAFSVPDFVFFLLISGALSVTFIPVFAERYAHGKQKEAWELGSSLLNLLGLITLGASVTIILLAPWLVHVIAGGADPAVKEQAVDLMRIVAVNPFLFGVASVLASMQQAVGRFFFNALAPVIYNLGIISGILFFAPSFGIRGVALGVGMGAIVQLLVQMIGMTGTGFSYQSIIKWRSTGLKKVLTTLPARSFDQGIDHLMAIVERFLASFLFAGAIAAYQVAFTLRNVPITLIGAAIATASFPKLSALAAKKESAFREDFIKVLRIMIWLSLPAAVIAFLLRGYLVRLLLGSGSQVVAVLLGWLSISIVFRVIFQVATRAFYAHQDTRTPLITSVVTFVVNIILSIILVAKLQLVGLVMAQTLVAVFEVIVLLILLQRKFGKIFTPSLFLDLLRMGLSTAGMFTTTYLMVRHVFPLLAFDVGFFALAPKFILIVLTNSIVYFALSALLGIKETQPVTKLINRVIFKPVKLPGS